jgi:3-hydroxyacyl-CoA dehydrogenase
MIAMATTSTSALDAKKLGFLRDGDRISMNRDHLLGDAKARVLELARDYVAPASASDSRAGPRSDRGISSTRLWAMREAGTG